MGSFSHKHSKGGRIHNGAQLAGDSRNTRCMLYPGSVKALLHDTTYAVCIPVLLIWGFLHVFSCDELCWLAWCMGVLVISIVRVAGYSTVPYWLETAATCAVCCTRDL